MIKKYLLISLSILIFISCSGTIKNREIAHILVKNIKEKKYDEALKNIKHKEFYPQKSLQLLKNIESGTVNYLAGNYYQALRYFEKSKKISDDLYTISIKNKLAGGFDTNLDIYYGEDYERSLIRFFISLINYNIYQQGFYEEHFDENNKFVSYETLTEIQKNFHLNYSRTSIIEWDSLLQSMQRESIGKSVYKNDMIAKIWGAFIHNQFDNSNDKQISIQLYKDADELLLKNYNAYPIFNNKSDKFNNDYNKLPNITLQELHKNYIEETKYSKDLQEFINRNRKNLEKNKKDNVIVLIKSDLISPKIVKTIEIPFPITSFGSEGPSLYEFARLIMSTRGGMPYILIEFPEIKEKGYINNYKAIVYNENGDEIASTKLILIEQLSDIAKKTFDDKVNLIKASMITRITAKYITALISSYALYNQDNTFSKIAALAMFKASSSTINETSRADIRYWTTLFSEFQMGGMILDRGSYKLVIEENNKKIFEKNITVNKDKITFLDFNFI